LSGVKLFALSGPKRFGAGAGPQSSSCACEQPLIEAIKSFHHLFDRKLCLDQLAPACAKFRAQFRIARQQQDSFGGGVFVAAANQEAGLIVQADFVGPIVVVGDDGFAGGQGLGQGAGQCFAARKMDQAVQQSMMPT
jgi:hypothetical protein